MVKDNMSLSQVVQNDINAWNEILHITGGKLAPSKTYYYKIQWEFTEEGVPFIKNTGHQGEKVTI